MKKDQFTPRDELICGKLDLLTDKVIEGDKIGCIDLINSIRNDAERMEQKLIMRKREAYELNKQINDVTK